MIQFYKRSANMNAVVDSKSVLRKISFAICVSNISGMACYLALSMWIFQETNSYAFSSMLFGCQWILPLIWPTGIARLTEHVDIGPVAARSEWCSAILSAALVGAVAIKIIPLVLILVIVRGFCDSLTRTTASLIVKFNEKETKKVEQGISSIEFWRIVGTCAAGMLFGFFGDRYSVQVFLVSSCVVYMLTSGLFRRLTVTAPENSFSNQFQTDFAKLRKALNTQPSAAKWLWLLGAVAAFQGLHNAIRVAYPDQQLGQGAAGVGIISTVSTIGVLCGGWFASRNRVIHTLKSLPGWFLIVLVGLTGIVAVFIPVAVPSYAIYFIFMTIFEVTFMLFNLNLVTSTDKSNISIILGFRTTILNAGTLSGLVITSIFLFKLTAAWSTMLTASLLVASSLVISYRYKLKKEVKNYVV